MSVELREWRRLCDLERKDHYAAVTVVRELELEENLSAKRFDEEYEKFLCLLYFDQGNTNVSTKRTNFSCLRLSLVDDRTPHFFYVWQRGDKLDPNIPYRLNCRDLISATVVCRFCEEAEKITHANLQPTLNKDCIDVVLNYLFVKITTLGTLPKKTAERTCAIS